MTMRLRQALLAVTLYCVSVVILSLPHHGGASTDDPSTTRTITASSSSIQNHHHQQHHTQLRHLMKEEEKEEYREHYHPHHQNRRRVLQEQSDYNDEGNDEPQPEGIPPYELWSPQEIRDTLLQWADHYPTLMKLTTAQEEFGLPAAGTAEDCPFDPDVDGCLNYIVTLQDFVTHPEGSASSNRLPEVLLSGEVHGNEQVGPTAVMEALSLVLKSASCIQYPRMDILEKIPSQWNDELQRARSCRHDLYVNNDIKESHMQWLTRLVSTRRVVIVPTANALGYFRTRREENGIDPNRDFPYDLQDSSLCMRTIAGRTLNEVFRQHMFQLSLTFHGGMEVVGYEWGAPSWTVSTSPDDVAQSQIAAAYSRFGGGWQSSQPYNYGPMNDYVYPVRGGMEDWAYAASWDTERVTPCTPQTFGGYPAEKTIYDNSTLRVFNMLVECSDTKIPTYNLGSAADLLKRNGAGNGHISRNLRLSLLAMELVQPWLAIRQVNELPLTDDIIPLQAEAVQRSTCQSTKRVLVPGNSRKVVVEWKVGGSLQVDRTNVWYAKWSDIPENALDCINQPVLNVVEGMLEGTAISATSGVTQFASTGTTHNGHFSASIDVSMFEPGDVLVVLAMARVDQEWANTKDPHVPAVPPQAHVVNARTNPNWHHVKPDGKEIQGRLDWFSQPLTIELGASSTPQDVETVELSTRWVQGPDHTPVDPPSSGSSSSYPNNNNTIKPGGTGGKSSFERLVVVVLFMGVVLGVAFVVRQAYLRYLMRQTQRSRLREFIQDESAPSPGLRNAKNGGGGANSGDGNNDGYSDHPDDDPEEVHEENGNGNGGGVELGRYSDRGGSSSSSNKPTLPRTMT